MEDDLTLPQIIDGLSAPIATTTADGRLDLVNSQFLNYLGLTLDELREWETSGVVHPDDLPRVVAAWRQSLECGEPYEFELRVRRADGIYRWMRVRGMPLRDTQGRILRWCVLLADIAERKCAEALLDGEKRLLEMVASGCPLENVLETMCDVVEALVGRRDCRSPSVLLERASEYEDSAVLASSCELVALSAISSTPGTGSVGPSFTIRPPARSHPQDT